MFDGRGLIYVVHDTSLNTYCITSLLDFNHRETASGKRSSNQLFIDFFVLREIRLLNTGGKRLISILFL